MKKRSIILVGCFSILFLINLLSAGVYFSDLDSKYNLGDMIELNVRVDPIDEGLLLKVTLFCNDNPVIDFNNFPEDDGNVNIKLPLNFNTINQANGNCYFAGSYGLESRKSMDFEISRLLIVRLSNDAFFANPGEEIIVSGRAEKLNGNSVDGEVEINIPLLNYLNVENKEDDLDDDLVSEEVNDDDQVDDEVVEDGEEGEQDNDDVVDEVDEEVEDESTDEVLDESVEVDYDAGSFYGKVVGGEFSISVMIPNDVPAGDFRIDVLVYEDSEGIRTSEGVTYANLKVFQVLNNIELNLNDQNFDPGSVVEIRPNLLDQTNMNIDDEVSIFIKNDVGDRFFEKIVSSGEILSYNIPLNLNSGYYEILGSNNDLEIVNSFFVNQKAIAKFELVDDTLIVTNVGNIPYKKGVEIELNGKPFVKVVELEIGESVSFKLTGSEEDYTIKVNDGNTEFVQSGVALTGRFVNVDEIGDSVNFKSPILWIFLFVLLLLVLFFIFRNVLKKKSFAFHIPGIKMKKKSGIHEEKVINGKKDAGNFQIGGGKGSNAHKQADQVMVLKGHKVSAVVLVIKIKNKLGNNEKKSLETAMENVYEKKGAVYDQGDFIFSIFSPLMTRVDNNEVLASRVAEKIIAEFNEHNKKFREKIDFGISINSGEIINKVESGKLKFTALGNFIVAAKRIAESSNNQVLMSKESFQKAGSEVKAEKISDGQVYDLRRVVDSKKNNKFIRGFLERQNSDKK